MQLFEVSLTPLVKSHIDPNSPGKPTNWEFETIIHLTVFRA